ncbi:mobilization protein [Pelotalea chapellei]|uniref:Mobilization protein n=1 Tax=Pelotalea chapellei TaxID=44671 RepID=A0ABS5UD59_9BACT|nr:mobilization protein [Pelotalea chapellei]MBT1073619.1 mobilization protein [Pelotalea chapellei]
MARKSAEDKLKALDEEREKLIDQLADKKAKELLLQERVKARESEQARKNDTRRKVLLGSFVLAKLKAEGERGAIHSWLEKELEAFLTNDRDKALFAEVVKLGGV